MNNELIKITEENGKQLVSAKELYLGLGLNKAVWSRWYKTNIVENEFFDRNKDWVGVQHDVEGNETMDFAISLEFAKHIAMMARTKKSHEYRNYFIECEKRLKENNPTIPKTYKEALKELLAQVEENEKLQLENKEMKPKAEFYDTVTESDTTIDMAKVSKILNIKGK